MGKRLGKQLIYGAVYLIILLLIVLLIYFIWFRPTPTCFDNKQNQGETGVDCGGPCQSCEIRTLVPLVVNWTKYFPNENQTVIAAEIKNSNLYWGADPFSYTFDIYGQNGTKINSFTKTSFIYESEIKYFVEVVDVDPKTVTNIQLSFSNVNWKSAKDFSKPAVQVREVKTEPALQDPTRVTVSGFATNNNAFALSKIRVIGFLFNTGGLQISASKTELENVPPFTEQLFKLNFPKNISVAASTTPSSAYNFTRNLTVGSSGSDVKLMQQFLKDQGFFNKTISNYFGAVTKDALIQYQKKIGISPASGYFGQKTRDYINSLKSSTGVNLSLTQADPTKTKIYVEAIQ